MRRQDITRLKALAASLDLDWMEFDFESFSSQEIEEQMRAKAGENISEMSNAEFVAWESMAEYYDDQPLDAKIVASEGYVPTYKFNNCLVLKFNQRNYGFALDLLKMTFKGNFMAHTKDALDRDRAAMRRNRILSFFGSRATTDRILEELRKHQIHPHILRNSYFRRDFLHFYNGKMYAMSKRDFEAASKKQSSKQERKELQLLKQMLAFLGEAGWLKNLETKENGQATREHGQSTAKKRWTA